MVTKDGFYETTALMFLYQSFIWQYRIWIRDNPHLLHQHIKFYLMVYHKSLEIRDTSRINKENSYPVKDANLKPVIYGSCGLIETINS